ncbi:VOC family protein [Micromonospora sp. NPDC047670]|uniref:VOC family protein n=1 Tax=Micromonospora sp. NPDC047670 TaxID=3364252 RepID=UPI00371CF131
MSDLAGVLGRLAGEGVAITMPLREEPWGERLFQVTDPNGVVIQFVEWVPRPPADPRVPPDTRRHPRRAPRRGHAPHQHVAASPATLLVTGRWPPHQGSGGMSAERCAPELCAGGGGRPDVPARPADPGLGARRRRARWGLGTLAPEAVAPDAAVRRAVVPGEHGRAAQLSRSRRPRRPSLPSAAGSPGSPPHPATGGSASAACSRTPCPPS